MANDLCYVEFVSDKLAETCDFVTKVFGWETKPSGAAYAEIRIGEGQLTGGIREEKPGGIWAQKRSTVYIEVEDVDAMLAKVEVAGGSTVIPKTEIGNGMGAFAFFNDPTGLTVGLYSNPKE